MSNSQYVGRVGALAVVFGVGTAIFAGAAVASADTPDSGSADPAAGSSAYASPGRTARMDAARPLRRSAGEGRAQRGAVAGAAASGAGRALSGLRLNSNGPTRSTGLPAALSRLAAVTQRELSGVLVPAPIVSSDPGVAAPAASLLPAPPVAAVPRRMASVVVSASSVANPDALAPRLALRDAVFASATGLVFLAQSVFRQLGIAVYLGPTRSMVNQSLVLNGYSLVPSTPEIVSSFYGPWTYGPGGPNLIQGQRQYEVIDPATGDPVGTFDALVSSGNPLTVGGRYVELLVTANDGVNVGTDPGQVPPVGSLIAQGTLIAGIGWRYSSLASESGNVLSLKLTTPLGNIPLPAIFDGAKGIADHTVDNRPVDLGNGYSIAPADPTGETFIGISGILPGYTALQGYQTFNIYDSTDNVVGSFAGVFTTTSDIAGLYTQAILVTANDGNNVGTAAGQVPPVGTVYNVIYEGGDTDYGLYTSMPSLSGDVISVIRVRGEKVSNIATFPLNVLNASAPPPVKRLPVGGGNGILPISALQPSGVNGLPPREVQVQGYQQFGVYDSTGTQIGSFDADVSTQWDMFGTVSQAILVTNVTDGTPGTAAGEIPPVGSMFNYVYLGKAGFGTYYAAKPTQNGTKVTFKFLTPLIDIPTWSSYNATAGFSTLNFYDPFVP